MTRTIKVDCLTRVEGGGALTIRFDGENVKDVELRIFEPTNCWHHSALFIEQCIKELMHGLPGFFISFFVIS